MAQGLVCAIILNWNGWSDTLGCLASLRKARPGPDTVVVVDNGSTDDSCEQIAKWAGEHYLRTFILDQGDALPETFMAEPPPFLLIRNKRNLGFAGGNNSGIVWALFVKHFQYIWLLNSDTMVDPESLASLLAWSRDVSGDIIGSTVVYADRPQSVQCAGGCRYSPVTTITRSFMENETLSSVLRSDAKIALTYVYGASFFVQSKLFAECGLLDERYFLFYEENDFCERVRRRGYTLSWCKGSIVYHKGSQSIGRPGFASSKKIAFANYHENLSTLLFSRKFYPYLLPFALFFRFFGKIFLIGKRGEWFLLRPLLHAYRDFLAGKNQREHYDKYAGYSDMGGGK
ncbi:MAG: glycosyltransferase family 2 protein [Pseudomonadota bacterium]